MNRLTTWESRVRGHAMLRRITAAIAVIAFIGPLAAHPTPAAAVGSYDNAAIADYALARVGQWGGQCRQFVNDVVWAVSGGTQSIGGGNGAFPNLAANGIEITDINALVKGDVVQFENSPVVAWLHTFIIVSHASGNTFNVVDSNWDIGSGNNEYIHAHQITFTLDPATRRAFRFGAVGSSTPPNQPPNKPSLVAPANGSAINSTSVTLTWSDNGDPDNKPNAYRDYYTELYLNGTLMSQQNWSTPTSWTISNLSAGTYEWRVKSGDGVLPSGWAGPWRFTVDTTPPTGSFMLNYGWATANSVSVPLDLTASDQLSGVQDVRLGSTCTTLGAWQPFQSRLWWQFAGQHGDTVRVCAQFRDRAGNLSQTIEQSIGLDFYPAQPASASYRLRSEVSASSGEPHQSSSYRLNSTAGQTLASGSYASGSGYRAALGFWPRSIQTSSTSTNQPPNRPTLVAPTNGSTASTSAPTFTWQDGGDPDNGPQATRSFRVSLHSLDGSLVAESGWLSGTSWTPPALSAGTYQWQVKAFDGAAESAWTGAWNLTIVTGTTTPDPYFKSDYTLGKPGSVFVFTAGNFPANAQATIAIRRPGMSDFATLISLPVTANGTLVFVLVIEDSATPGVYTVRITVESTQPLSASAETQAVLTLEQPLTIAEEAILHDDPPPQGAPVVPASGVKVFLPLLMR